MYAAWRAKASKSKGKEKRLLVSQEEGLEAFKARSRRPSSTCGVSLAFLERLKESLEDLGLEGKARTTQAVVARLISPAGVVHLPAPEAKQRNSMDVAPRPVSRSLTLRPLANNGTATSRDRQTASHGLSAKELRTRMWDFIEPHWCGKPSYYVCYAWGGDFLEMLETVVDRVMRPPEEQDEEDDGSTEDDGGEDGESDDKPAKDPSSIFVWLDVLALPQQYHGGASSPEGPIFGPPQGYVDTQEVKDIVVSCEQGTVFVLDKAMAILGRTWPLYEIWLAAYYSPHENGFSRVYAAIPKDIHVDMLLQLQIACQAGLDLGRTTSSKPEDKQHIMTEVRNASGLKRMQGIISDAILRATRGWLRWSGEAQDMGLYAALMLQSKEYAQLQYVLNSVDEIHDDEATLKEIRDLFALFDSDGGGSLDEEEFIQVLAMAGFGAEEAHSIFKQVDADGGGSVELEEFEAWWIQSQREHNRNDRKKPALTLESLVANLQGLVALLQRKQHNVSADRISQLIAELQASAANPRSPFTDGMLPPSEVYGDWRAVANTLGFRITSSDLRPALRMLHGLLLANVDTLALDASPASVLPAPSSLGSDAKLHKVVLGWFMALMAELLSRNPTTIREADFFYKEATDIAMPEKEGVAAHSASRALEAAITKAKKDPLNNGRNDFQMESIVTDMVRLKHGKDAIVSNKLVKEANISLSAWMASSKERKSTAKKGGGAPAPNTSSIAAFTASYLGDSKSPRKEAASDGPPTSNNGNGAKFVANQKANAQKGPFAEMSHDQLARALGAATQAALQAHKGHEKEKRRSEDSSTSESVQDMPDSESKPGNGRVSPLKMAQRLSKSSEHEASGTKFLKRQNTTSLSGLQTSSSGMPGSLSERKLQKSFTSANGGPSYANKKQEAGAVEPSRTLHSRYGSTSSSPRHNTSSSGSTVQFKAASSLGAPLRPEVPHLRHLPVAGEPTPSSIATDERPLKSLRSSRGSSGPYQTRVQEQDLEASQRQHTYTPHPPSNQPPFVHPQPPTQPNPQHPGHSSHSSHGHRPTLGPHPHANPHPQGQPVMLSQKPYETGGGKVQVLDPGQRRQTLDNEESEADAEVRRSLDIPRPPPPARAIQTPLAGTMRSKLGPGSSLGIHQQQQQQQQSPSIVPNPQQDASSFFGSMPWHKASQDRPVTQGTGARVPMLERMKGMFGRGNTAATAPPEAENGPLQEHSQGSLRNAHTQQNQHHTADNPTLSSDLAPSSFKMPGDSSNRLPSAFASQPRAHAGYSNLKGISRTNTTSLGFDDPQDPTLASHNETRTSPNAASSSLMLNGFAQRFAAMGAQQRAVTPSVQPLVGERDLEALQNRKSMTGGLKESMRARSRAASPSGGRSGSPTTVRDSYTGDPRIGSGRESSAAGSRERGPATRSVRGPSNSGGTDGFMSAPHSPIRSSIVTLPTGNSGRNSVDLSEPQHGRSGSRLRNATTPGLSQMALRNAASSSHASSGSKSKWFKQLSGTSLPSLQRPTTSHNL